MPAKKTNTLDLSALLSPAQIYIVPPGQTKQAVIRRLVELICHAEPALGPEEVLREVLRREEGISTTLDTGLSIPHARLEEIADFKAALAVFPTPLPDPVNPHHTIKAMFLFLSPSKPEFFQRHLQILAALAQTFKPEFMDELAQLQMPQDVLAHFKPRP